MSDVLSRDVWERLLEFRTALSRQYEAEVVAAIGASGAPMPLLGMLLHAADIAPEPLTVAGLLGCTPYYAAEAFHERMVTLATSGWFESPTEGAYLLSSRGSAAIVSIEGAAEAKLAAVATTCDVRELATLDGLVGRVAQAARAYEPVPNKGCLRATGNLRPKLHQSPLAAIEQSVGTLEAFRCDGHRAAWQHHVSSGATWELLTVMWQGQANSAESMLAWSEHQGFPRGFTAEQYTESLSDLVAHGWAEATSDPGIYRLTDTGIQLRQAVEDTTDVTFYSVWSVLTPAETAHVQELAVALLAQLPG